MTDNDSRSIPWENLRPSQHAILHDYNGGRMGISAVPGSGKTYTLSMLAADLILNGDLDIQQEVLIVTMSNSAVDNFSQRIGGFLQQRKMLPGLGYRIRTLHGLANDIVRERPGLVNLANDFSIIDEREAIFIREQAADAWLHANPSFFNQYFQTDLEEHQFVNLLRNDVPKLVQSAALSIIRYAKDQELTPADLRSRMENLPSATLPLAWMGCDIYEEYQRSLAYRGAVDFDDLIRLALAALHADPHLTQRLREQWPFVLEDEAQDSSRLQEEILRILCGDNGNWVRVGDPNQAIYETFTTANPQHLLDFIALPRVLRKELPVSGRSTRSIIHTANWLIDWVREQHPILEVRDALHLPYIAPTEPGDPQTNPTDAPERIYFAPNKQSPADELNMVVKNLTQWQQNQDAMPEPERETLVVLDLSNSRGAMLANLLREKGVDPIEFLKTTTKVKQSADTLSNLLRYLANPQSTFLLPKAFSVWRRMAREDSATQAIYQRAGTTLRRLKYVEDYLDPLPGKDWLEKTELQDSDPGVYAVLQEFRVVVHRWHGAALLPIDQLVLTLSQDIFHEPVDLAIAHKLAAMLRQKSNSHPGWSLPEQSEELEAIVKSKGSFIGFSEDDTGFDPERYRGRIIITTMHKAKGLEWDRVYLLSVNNYDFPSGRPYDEYYSEKWFLMDHMNFEAEALAQLKAALATDEYDWYVPGQASQVARLDCVRERLRLLYVGITRARRSLVVTWNTGKTGKSLPAEPFLALQAFWEQQRSL